MSVWNKWRMKELVLFRKVKHTVKLITLYLKHVTAFVFSPFVPLLVLSVLNQQCKKNTLHIN